MTRNEKLLAIARKALHKIARNQSEDPDVTAQWLMKMASIKKPTPAQGER